MSYWYSIPAMAHEGDQISPASPNKYHDGAAVGNLTNSNRVLGDYDPEAFRLVVGVEEGTDIAALAEKSGGELIRTGPLHYCTLQYQAAAGEGSPEGTGKEDLNRENIRNKVLEEPGVLSAEWSKRYTIDNTQATAVKQAAAAAPITDPEFSTQWALKKIRADQVWEEGATGKGVIIAVVDTGVDLSHPDLVDDVQDKNNLVQGYNAFTGSALPGSDKDDNGHGTTVAGVIAALNNGRGMVGIAYDAMIMPIKAMDKDGEGEDDIIADGIIWAADHGAKIINMSIGSDNEAKVLEDAIQYAVNKGCLLVAASGNVKNTNTGVAYPGANPNVLAVSAVDNNDSITDFSLTGPEVALSAPGKRILTTFWSKEESGFAYSTGTSIAAPFVSASAALLWSKYPALTASEINEALLKSAYDLGTKGVDEYYGYGRLDVYRALKTLQEQKSYTSPANISWEGGRIYTGEKSEEPDGVLTIPAGAFPLQTDSLGKERTLTVSLNSIKVPADFPEGITPAGEPFQIRWGEAIPVKALTLAVRIQPAPDKNQISYLYKWSGTRWLRAGGGMGDSAGTLQTTFYEPGIYRAGWSPEPDTDRIAGIDRIHTAIEISAQTFPTGADTVLIARADDFPDALAGAPLAYKYQAPILLTYPNSLPLEVYQSVQDLAPKRIILLGGTGAVSRQVENQLANIATVTRIAGENRYETAAAVAERLGTTGEAVVVNGSNYPDAISAASHAACQGMPILLTQKDSLMQNTEDILRKYSVTSTEVIGGTGAISDKVLRELPQPERISGQNRFDTSAEVIDGNKPAGKIFYIATGNNFPDALTGGILASSNSADIMLLSAAGPTPVQKAVLKKIRNKKVIALGGEGAVPDDLIRQIQTLVNSQ